MSTETRARNDPRDHVVQFYAHETDLQRVVGRYLADAIRTGGTAVAATTGAHGRAFDTVITDLGEDPDEARRDGRLLTIDAADVAARLGDGVRPEADVFHDAIAGPLRRAASAGRPLFVFGEIVAILWGAGQVVAAIDLEDRWNRLRSEIDFSLLCAYPLGSVEGRDHASARIRVCHLHSAVIGALPDRGGTPDLRDDVPPENVLRIPRSSLAPKRAREFVAAVLDRWAPPDLIDDAALVVTELAANAVLHARSDLTVTVSRRPGGVRIAVQDDSLISPMHRGLAPTAASGRGMTLVAAIADWGTEITGEGKIVWADLATPAWSGPPGP